MAEASVTVKLTPREFDTIRDALHTLRDQNEDLINDPAVKEDDKQGARESFWYCTQVLQRFES